jgi:hypothetical protein
MNPPSIGNKAWTKVLTMGVKDGGEYDQDGQANGQISVLFGKALSKGKLKSDPTPTTPPSGGGGGCNVSGNSEYRFFYHSPAALLARKRKRTE